MTENYLQLIPVVTLARQCVECAMYSHQLLPCPAGAPPHSLPVPPRVSRPCFKQSTT